MKSLNNTQKYGVSSYPTHVIVGKDGLFKFSTVDLAANTVSWIGKNDQRAILACLPT